jgi:hypothetical protein
LFRETWPCFWECEIQAMYSNPEEANLYLTSSVQVKQMIN